MKNPTRLSSFMNLSSDINKTTGVGFVESIHCARHDIAFPAGGADTSLRIAGADAERSADNNALRDAGIRQGDKRERHAGSH